jgi:hypothetical protein
MTTIVLNNGLETFVDELDFEYLSNRKWFFSNGYAIASDNLDKMHRVIIGAKKGELVDHIDRNKLNNSRSNLRIVDKEGNVHNQKKRANTNNNYKGVNYVKRLNLYQSRCRIYGNDYFLGYYKTEISAAYAYNKKAVELSDCILLNKIDLPIEFLEQKLIDDLSQIIPAENTSTYNGVCWHKKSGRAKCGKWGAKIRINGKYKYLGRFINEIDAINAIEKEKSS